MKNTSARVDLMCHLVEGETKVPLPESDDQVHFFCARELLQHEGLGREEEAASEEGAEQHRSILGSHQCGGGAHRRKLEGVQGLLKHHECANERTSRAARRIVLR